PFFLLNGPHYVDNRYGDNWLEYYFVQNNISEAERNMALSILKNAAPEPLQGGIRMFRPYANFPPFPRTSLERLSNELFELDITELSTFFFKNFILTAAVTTAVEEF